MRAVNFLVVEIVDQLYSAMWRHHLSTTFLTKPVRRYYALLLIYEFLSCFAHRNVGLFNALQEEHNKCCTIQLFHASKDYIPCSTC